VGDIESNIIPKFNRPLAHHSYFENCSQKAQILNFRVFRITLNQVRDARHFLEQAGVTP